MKNWKEFKKRHYKQNIIVQVEGGLIDFRPEGFKELENGDVRSYDEFLDIQMKSLGRVRSDFEYSYLEDPHPYLKGEIEKINSKRILFKRIYLDGMHMDGTGFEGKEDHVWMDVKGFEKYKKGDCVRFSAEVYRYIKKSNGKFLDYGLRDPYDIELVGPYEVPTDEDLLDQEIDKLVCELCMYNEHCYMGMCIADPKYREEQFNRLKELHQKMSRR